MAWRREDVPFQGSQPPGPRFSAPNPQARPVRQEPWLLGVEPQEVALLGVLPSEVLLSALPQVAPRIQVLLLRARPHRGEWVLSADPLVALPPEVSLLVGPLCQVLPRQVQLVLQLQAQPHPESPRRGRQAGLLVALPRQVLPRQVLVAQPHPESQPPVLRAGLLASPPQVGQQQEKHQAAGSSPQGS